MANLPTLAQRCAELHSLAPTITYTTGFIWSGISLVVGAVSGWYVKGRGMAGVKIDLDNVKNDLSKLKAQIDAKTA